MSETYSSSLGVMDKSWLTNCYGEEVSQLLTGENIPKRPVEDWRRPWYYRYLSIITENGWFYSKVKELQNLSGIGGLAYLHEDIATHEHKVVCRDDNGKVVWMETHGYTVINSGWDEEIAAIRALQDWCRSHPAEAGHILEVPGDWVIPALESRFFTLNPSNEGLGDGNGHESFFCTLHTISELMHFAKFHKAWLPDIWVLYHRVLRYGS
ncbi:MAG: hypothetical protein ACU836_18095 [Gammaproteobacteria bacterium]